MTKARVLIEQLSKLHPEAEVGIRSCCLGEDFGPELTKMPVLSSDISYNRILRTNPDLDVTHGLFYIE